MYQCDECKRLFDEDEVVGAVNPFADEDEKYVDASPCCHAEFSPYDVDHLYDSWKENQLLKGETNE